MVPRWLHLTSTRGLDAHHRKYNRFLAKLSTISINVNVSNELRWAFSAGIEVVDFDPQAVELGHQGSS